MADIAQETDFVHKTDAVHEADAACEANTTHETDIADAAHLTKLVTKLTLLITLISISRVIDTLLKLN